MFGMDVALIILLALVFGFVNGWVLNRQISGGTRPEDQPPEFSLAADPPLRMAETEERPDDLDPPRAAAEPSEYVPDHEVMPRQPEFSDEERRTMLVRVRTLETQRRQIEAEAAKYRTEARNLEARIQLLEPLIAQVRDRDERLADLNRKFQTAVIDREAELERGKGRISDLEAALRSLHARLEVFEAESADAEERRAESRRERGLNGTPLNGHGPTPRTDAERRLRAEVADRDQEIERLRLMIDELRRGVAEVKAVIETSSQ